MQSSSALNNINPGKQELTSETLPPPASSVEKARRRSREQQPGPLRDELTLSISISVANVYHHLGLHVGIC